MEYDLNEYDPFYQLYYWVEDGSLAREMKMKFAVILYNSVDCELDRKIYNGDGDDVQDSVCDAVQQWSINAGDIIKIVIID